MDARAGEDAGARAGVMYARAGEDAGARAGVMDACAGEGADAQAGVMDARAAGDTGTQAGVMGALAGEGAGARAGVTDARAGEEAGVRAGVMDAHAAGDLAAGIRAVFFDIDGTLLPEGGGPVPPSARQAIATLRERGVRVVVATGRHPIELDEAGLDDLAFDGFAAANGQMCLDGQRRLFAGYPIPQEGVASLLGLAEEGQLIWFFGEDCSYASRQNQLLVELATVTTGRVPEVRPYDGMTVYQAVAFVSEAEEEALAARLPGCRLQRWGALGVDIIAADGGKVEGMKAFLERFGCTREQCMAFGDQHNDLDMLRFAGIGVAMGNATPQVKAVADHVTSSVEDDGVAVALRHFGLI